MNKMERQRNFFNICNECKIHCCRNARPPITLERKKIIEKYLHLQKTFSQNSFLTTEYTFPKEDEGGFCIFYDKRTRRCSIQVIKPETCVAGPVTFDINKRTQKIEWYLKKEEICPLAGILFKDEKMFKDHLTSAKKEILRLVNQLNSKELKAILKREEPETFKICENEIGKDILDKI
jgi:Fe-S-cluster containining protein